MNWLIGEIRKRLEILWRNRTLEQDVAFLILIEISFSGFNKC
jgi:hypothetical protein